LIYRNRVCNFFLDFINYKRRTEITGWRFGAVIVVVGDLVVHKVLSGVPAISEVAENKNPLGPLQENANTFPAPVSGAPLLLARTRDDRADFLEGNGGSRLPIAFIIFLTDWADRFMPARVCCQYVDMINAWHELGDTSWLNSSAIGQCVRVARPVRVWSVNCLTSCRQCVLAVTSIA
jgi:hypothetical protein